MRKPFGVEAQRVAHAAVLDAGGALPRPPGLVGQAEFGHADAFQFDAGHVAEFA